MESSGLFFAWATIFAVFAGPITAVLITRKIDQMRFKKERRLDVFKTLMRTRRIALNPDHVSALNLVEVEFWGCEKVQKLYRLYWENLHKLLPTDHLKKFGDDREALLSGLLKEMGKELGMSMDQLDIFRGGYVPQGWLDVEDEQAQLRLYLIQMLNGQCAIPITTHLGSPENSPFPPPPKNL